MKHIPVKALFASILLLALQSCGPINGADPLDNGGGYNTMTVVEAQEDGDVSSFRGEIGTEVRADF